MKISLEWLLMLSSKSAWWLNRAAEFIMLTVHASLAMRASQDRVPTPPGKSWILLVVNSRTWKVLENHFGPGKSWKLKLTVLERPRKMSLNVVHFSSCSNGKQLQYCSTQFVLNLNSEQLTSTFCFMLNFLQWTTLCILLSKCHFLYI